MNNIILTKQDADLLSRDMSVTAKSETIRKISHYYQVGEGLSLVERKIAEDIFRIMVKDLEVKVREVLAESLKKSTHIPEDIVVKIINDENSVSLSFIKEYKSLTDTDLVNILKSQNVDKQKAVAMRNEVSSNISSYIAKECDEEVVVTLLANNGADIVEDALGLIVDKYKDSEAVKEKLVDRAKLPVSIVEKIISSLSEDLGKRMIAQHDLPGYVVSNLVSQVRDKSTIKFSQEYNSDREVELLVSQLYITGKLSSDLVVRSACMGDLKFFEYSLAVLTNKTVVNIRKILHSGKDDFVIRNLFREAHLPSSMFLILIFALKIVKDVSSESHKEKGFSVSQKVIERLLTTEVINSNMSEKEVEFLVSKIG